MEEEFHPNFVLGVRPEFIEVTDQGAFEGEVFSAMPTGMETTLKIKIGNFLLTGVVFGGVLYTIGDRIRFNFHGDNAMLFDKQSGKLMTLGSLKQV